ncbi:MAG: hypothetical protein ACLVCM_08730 [Lachnospira sp.]
MSISEEELEMCKLIISIVSIVATSIFSLVTIIITCHNANKQIKESEKALKQQEEQFKNSIMLQKEQYEKENLHNKEIVRIQKRPYLVIDKSTNCMCLGDSDHHITICFKNKGNGSAFKIEPVTEITASNGNTIIREEPIQDPIVMVNELCETKWKFDSPKRDFQFSIIVKFEDMSAQLYQQTFILTLDSELHIMVMNYAEPKLVSE